MDSLKQYLESCALSSQAAEKFRNPERITGTQFDPELAYVHTNSIGRDGMNGARVFYSFEKDGARRRVNYGQLPCRLNTYGDSFTECNQVSDGETWQEILAAHFGEPIRNYGVGGYGVYQAYLRMKRVESGPNGAPYILLNIFSDDHRRNLMACRWIHLWDAFHVEHRDDPGFHAMPWAHLRLDPQTGSWRECPNPFTTPESLCRLSDPVFVYETFRQDPIVKLCYGDKKENKKDKELQALAEYFKVELDQLYTTYALASTAHIAAQAKAFAESRAKQLMIVLSYGTYTVARVLGGHPRFDQSLVAELMKLGVPIVDTLAKHAADFKAFRLTPEEYCRRFYIGHYNPPGNQFFAYAIKDELAAWLQPKPPAYNTAAASDTLIIDRLIDQV